MNKKKRKFKRFLINSGLFTGRKPLSNCHRLAQFYAKGGRVKTKEVVLES